MSGWMFTTLQVRGLKHWWKASGRQEFIPSGIQPKAWPPGFTFTILKLAGAG